MFLNHMFTSLSGKRNCEATTQRERGEYPNEAINRKYDDSILISDNYFLIFVVYEVGVQGSRYAHLTDGIPFGILHFAAQNPKQNPTFLFFGILLNWNPIGIPLESHWNPIGIPGESHWNPRGNPFWNPTNCWNPSRIPSDQFLESYFYVMLYSRNAET